MLSKDFLWGGATAANQMEGGYNEGGKGLTSDDVLTGGTKKDPRRITFRYADGTTGSLSMYDIDKMPEGAVIDVVDGFDYPNHDAIDFYHHYKEDIKLFAELGLNCLRMSLSWARIYPNGIDEEPNEEGLKFYEDVFAELKKYNIEPLITISHYETPLAFSNLWNSWADRRTIDCFVKFCETIFTRYKDTVKYWLTFNEINCMTLGCWGAWMAGGVVAKDEETNINAAHYQLVASAKAVALGKKINPNFKFGCMLEMAPCYAYTCDPRDTLEALKDMHEFWVYGDVQVRGKYPKYKLNEWAKKGIHLDLTEDDQIALKAGSVDFAAFSYYMTRVKTVNEEVISNSTYVNGNLQGGMENPYLATSEWGWQIDPVGLRVAIDLLYERYDIPVMVVEIGLGATDQLEDGEVHDPYRISFLKDHIEQLKLAVEEDGAEVLGVFPWGFIDQVSASTGEMAKRYGVIYVDKQDDGTGKLDRIKKDSFYWYQKVIKSNGEEL